MVNSLRKFSKPIMLVITVIVIVSFTVWAPNIMRNGNRQVVNTLGGKDLMADQLQDSFRKLSVYHGLGLPYGMYLSGQKVSAVGAARAIVFEHEADALGVSATVSQLHDMFEQVPSFRDPETREYSDKYFSLSVRQIMNPNGYSAPQVDDFLEGQIRFDAVMKLVGSAVQSTPDEAKEGLRKEQMTIESTYVELKQADFEKDIKVTEEDLKKTYDEGKEHYKTLPQRRVKYAAFSLPPAPAGAPQDEEKTERNRLLQEYGNKAYSLRAALDQPGTNFEETAKAMGAQVGTTEFFDIQHAPPELEGSPVVAQAAFKLTKDAPYSAQLTKGDGLRKGAYVLYLAEEKAPEQKPFDAVKAQIETTLKQAKSSDALATKAKELKTKIDEALKGGKNFYKTLEELGQKPVALPVFGPGAEPQGYPFASAALEATRKLAPGQLSDPTPVGSSTLLVYLDRRIAGENKEPAPEAVKAAQEERTQQLQRIAFAAWLEAKCNEAGATPDRFRDQ